MRKFKERLAQTHPEFASKPKEEKDEPFLAGEPSGFEVIFLFEEMEINFYKRLVKELDWMNQDIEERLNSLDLFLNSNKAGGLVSNLMNLLERMMEGKRIIFIKKYWFYFSAKGVKYFDCAPSYGMFVRPTKCQQGDFPELGLDDDEDDDEL